MKKFLIAGAVVATIALGVAGFTAWLYWTSVRLHTVGDSATFEESAECLYLYSNDLAGRPYSLRLDGSRVEACFPPQTAAKTKALITCFNTYEREHRGHFDHPGGNLRACAWEGVTASRGIATVIFGKVVAVPAVPRAGRRVVLELETRAADAEIIHEAVASDTLEVDLRIDGDESTDPTFPRQAYGLDADGKFRVNTVVPAKAAGKRVTLTMTTAPDTPSAVTTVATFTIAG